MGARVDPYELVSRGDTRAKVKHADRAGFGVDSEFLAHFPDRRIVVSLPCVQVTGNRRVPQAGVHVLGLSPPLQEDISLRVTHQNMDRPVAQALRMHFRARRPGNHPILSVHYVKNFLLHVFCLSIARRPLLEPTFPMSKIEVSKVAEILKKHQVAPALMRRILEEINLATQPDPVDDIKPPPLKKQWAIMISDPNGDLPDTDFTGWVLQVPEDASLATIGERTLKAAYGFNASRKGRLLPVKTIGEAYESVPARYFKDSELWVKTKIPVQVLRTDNELPVD